MSSALGDLFPFGDVDDEVLTSAASRFPGLPVNHASAAFSLLRSLIALLEGVPEPLEEAGLSPARWRLLIALVFQAPEGATVGELARRLAIREPTVTATVDRAARDGHVERRRLEADRRVVRVTATAHGIQTVADVLPMVAGRVVAVVDTLGGPEAVRELSRGFDDALAAARAAPALAGNGEA